MHAQDEVTYAGQNHLFQVEIDEEALDFLECLNFFMMWQNQQEILHIECFLLKRRLCGSAVRGSEDVHFEVSVVDLP